MKLYNKIGCYNSHKYSFIYRYIIYLYEYISVYVIYLYIHNFLISLRMQYWNI